MRLHKIRIYFIQRRANIIFFLMALGMFTTLIVGTYLLIETRKTQLQNQQILKGLSCVLLIKPEERTAAKITNCIENNTQKNEDRGFEFNTNNTKKESDESSRVITGPKELSIYNPIIPTLPKNSPSPAPTARPSAGTSVEVIPEKEREIETRINANGELECRVISNNDTGWQLGDCK